MYKELALQINNNCNLNCPFCFSDKSNEYISIENVKVIKDFCEKEKVDTIKITGGEPFLHPDVFQIIGLLSNFNIFIFSNLSIKNCLLRIPNIEKIKSITILVNLNESSFYDKELLNNIYENLTVGKKIGVKFVLGRTFYKEPFYIDDIIKLCQELDIFTIRVSQSSPKVAKNNKWLEYDETNRFLRKMYLLDKEILSHNKIKLHFDCPVKPCKIDKEVFDYFYDKKSISYKCRPRIFIGYDLKIKHCYANEILYPNKYLYQFDTYQDIFNYIENTNIKLTMGKSNCYTDCSYYGDTPCGCLSDK